MCNKLDHNVDIAAYFKPNSTDQLREFIRERPNYFTYDRDRDKVSLPGGSRSIVIEEYLVEFMALQIQTSSGSLNIAHIGF